MRRSRFHCRVVGALTGGSRTKRPPERSGPIQNLAWLAMQAVAGDGGGRRLGNRFRRFPHELLRFVYLPMSGRCQAGRRAPVVTCCRSVDWVLEAPSESDGVVYVGLKAIPRAAIDRRSTMQATRSMPGNHARRRASKLNTRITRTLLARWDDRRAIHEVPKAAQFALRSANVMPCLIQQPTADRVGSRLPRDWA